MNNGKVRSVLALTLTILLFLENKLALTLAAAGFFADKLDHIGPRLGLPEAIVGLLTAVAADAPELSSAVVALTRGEKDVSLGVVLGSNVFNLAAMIGVSAVLAGTVAIGRRALAVEGVVGLAATVVAGALILGVLPAWLALALFAGIAVPYLVVVSRGPAHHTHAHHVHEGALWKPIALIVPAVGLIVLGATGMVRTALVLADDWHVSKAVVGLVVLAVLTSLPNAFTAVRLGRAGRGTALVSETLGSNTINLVGAILIPALVVGLAGRSGVTDFNLVFLLGMTCVALITPARARTGPARRRVADRALRGLRRGSARVRVEALAGLASELARTLELERPLRRRHSLPRQRHCAGVSLAWTCTSISTRSKQYTLPRAANRPPSVIALSRSSGSSRLVQTRSVVEQRDQHTVGGEPGVSAQGSVSRNPSRSQRQHTRPRLRPRSFAPPARSRRAASAAPG